MTISEILIAEAIYHEGEFKKIIADIRAKKILPDEDIIRLNRKMRSKAITIMDSNYPEYLRHMSYPPLVLFYYGDISLIAKPTDCLGVVGTRGPSAKASEVTKNIVSQTCKRYITVSGLAKGIDRIAHETAIDNGGKTIAVLGCGIDNCYPAENQELLNKIKKEHLVVSEYPGLTPPNQWNFPIRNRLIAMFSKGILVTESKIKSGTSITVNFGLCYGREIMCTPSSDYNDSGCNKFIKEGASLVENADDVFLVME